MDQAATFETGGDPVSAKKLYQKLITRHPKFAPACHALGVLELQFGDVAVAIQWLSQAVRLERKNGQYQSSLCRALRVAGQVDKAVIAGRRAVEMAPDNVDAHFNLALALADNNVLGESILHYTHALTLRPQYDLAWNNLGVMLEKISEYPSAEYAYNMALSINPRNATALNNLGAMFAKLGDIARARLQFQSILDSHPAFVPAHFNLSSLKTYASDDPHLEALKKLEACEGTMPSVERIQFNFALGKALEDVGDYAHAFNAYTKANNLHHALHPYPEDHAQKLQKKVTRIFNADFFSNLAMVEPDHNDEPIPLFIIGMPRSGTTLIEQILCSHRDVHGAGEIMDLSQVIEEFPAVENGMPFPEWTTLLDAEDFLALGREYLSRVRKLAPDKRFITDKMLGNYHYVGIIRLMMPQAKIIHVMRDARDACFSCYARHFDQKMDFTYDWERLSGYYRRYIEQMGHWRAVLPHGSILDVHYEDIVADIEGQTRRMLEYIGLPWDSGCLDFYNNKRLVTTASMAQVCRPIYPTSVARWRRFEAYLSPIFREWTDFGVAFENLAHY